MRGDPPQRHLEHAPAIVVEITSPTTAERDCTAKRELYQQHGVDYYLLVAPQERILLVLNRDQHGELRPIDFAEEALLEICETCSLRIAPASIFTAI